MGKSKLFLFFIIFVITTRAYALDNPSFFKGFTHMNDAHYDEAIMYFNISLKANPDYLPVYSHLALCYERKGDYTKAAEIWTKYSEFNSYFKDTVIIHIELIDKFLKAEEHIKFSQSKEAMPLLEEIAATDKYPMSVLWVNAAKILGEIYFKCKSYDRVINLYEKISLYYPKDVTEEILFRYAYSYQHAREFQKAIDIYKKLDQQFKIKAKGNITKYKNMVSLCYEGLGDEAFALDDHKKAKEIYEIVIKGFPIAENVSRVNQKKQKVEEQLAFFYKTEGDTYTQMKEYSKAMEFYERLGGECPGSKLAVSSQETLRKLKQLEYSLYMEGFRHFVKGKPKECRNIYTEFLQRFPQSKYAPKVQKFIGFAYADENRYKESIRELMKVAKNYPDSISASDALERIGVYFWGPLNEQEKAEKVFRYLIKKYPQSSSADSGIYFLGCLNLDKEDYKKAYYYFRYLCKKYPESYLVKRAKVQMGMIKSKVNK